MFQGCKCLAELGFASALGMHAANQHQQAQNACMGIMPVHEGPCYLQSLQCRLCTSVRGLQVHSDSKSPESLSVKERVWFWGSVELQVGWEGGAPKGREGGGPKQGLAQ